MSALQSGLLWWLAMSVSFTLGWGMCALVSQGRDVERRVDEAIRIGRKDARFARKARVRGGDRREDHR